MTNQEVARDVVSRLFPGLGFVEMTKASTFIGIDPKTGRNWLCAGKYPLPTSKVGDKRLVPVPALIEWYARQLSDAGVGVGASPAPASTQVKQVKRGRGRPRKQQKGGV